jgi:hypothetical protein
MLRTGRLRTPKEVIVAPLRRRPLDRRREPRYRGPWRLLGPDSHRLAALNLTPGYIRTSFPARMPGLLDVRRFIWHVLVDLFDRQWRIEALTSNDASLRYLGMYVCSDTVPFSATVGSGAGAVAIVWR